MDLEAFVRENKPVDSDAPFVLQNKKLLDVKVDDAVFLKAGSMIGFTGDIEFTGITSAEGGIGGFLKQKVTNEGTPVMKAEGNGRVYVADNEKKIQVFSLEEGEGISINGNDILAFQDTVDYSIDTVGGFGSVMAGGLTNVFLEGPGVVAITTHGDPLILSPPVFTDPQATIAWSSNLNPSAATQFSAKDIIGQSSGESMQMEFSGDEGFVVVQPFEENPQAQRNNN